MAYWGNEPAKVAVKVGNDVITSVHIEDGQVYTADLQNDAVTASKIDDDGTGFQMGSLGLGTAVSGSHKLTVGGTASFSGAITGDLTGNVTGNTSGTAATVTGGTQASITSAANLVTVGTIGTGVWNGTAVASAYLDADTAHLSGIQTFSGAKKFQANMIIEGADFAINRDSSKLSFNEGDGTNKANMGFSLNTGDIMDLDLVPDKTFRIRQNTGSSARVALELAHTTGNATFAGNIGLCGTAPNAAMALNVEYSTTNYIMKIQNDHATDGHGVLIRAGDDGNTESFHVQTHNNTSLFKVLGDGNATFAGNLTIPEYVYHAGDTDTYIRFIDGGVAFSCDNTTPLVLDATSGTGMAVGGNATFAKAVTIGDSSGSDELLVQGGAFPVARINNMGGGETGIRFRSYENGSNQLHADIKVQETGDETGTFKICMPHSVDAITIDGSSNATFAGTVSLDKADGGLYFKNGSGTTRAYLQYQEGGNDLVISSNEAGSDIVFLPAGNTALTLADDLSATFTGAVTFNDNINAPKFYSSENEVPNCSSGSPYTVFTASNSIGALWLVNSYLVQSDSPTNYHCVALVTAANSNYRIVHLQTANNFSMSITGATVQSTQSSGGTYTIKTSITRLG